MSSENASLLVRREQERVLKQHQDRVLRMKPCVHSQASAASGPDCSLPLAASKRQQPLRARIDKNKLRQIEKQNYRLLMKLRYIHKNYSLYMPKKHVYLQRGEAGRIKKPAKKPAKTEEAMQNSSAEILKPSYNRVVGEEMANRVAAVNLWKT